MRADLNQFQEEGYAIVKDFLTQDDLQAFEANLQAMCEDQLKQKSMSQKESEPLIDLFNIGGEYRKLLYQSMQYLPILSTMQVRMNSILEEDGFLKGLGFVSPLIRSALLVALPNEPQFDNPVHQDVYSCISHRALRFWIPLRSVDEHYGSMRVFPKSHTKGFIPHDDITIPTYPAIAKENYQEYEEILFRKDPGDAVIFSPMLIHESIANVSERVRLVASIEIQDIAALPNFNDPEDAVVKMINLSRERKAARAKLQTAGK